MMTTLGSFLDPACYRLHAWFLGGTGPLVDVLRSSGIAAESVPWRYGARDPAGMFRFFRASKGKHFALVHQHFGGRSVRRLARWLLRSPIIVHLHGRIDEAAGVVSPIAMADAEAVIAVSRAVASNVLGTRPYVVHPGIAVPGGEPPIPAIRSAGIVIGTATRLVTVKGIGYLLRAFAALRKRHPEVRLEIAGAGGEERALHQLAHDLGIANAVWFLGWRVELAALMRTWDIYAQASLEEGFGMSILEAMAAGLPVVATEVGGIGEIVDGATGTLVPARDTEAMADALAVLANDANLRTRMGSAGRRRACEAFSASRMAREIERIYSSVLFSLSRGT